MKGYLLIRISKQEHISWETAMGKVVEWREISNVTTDLTELIM